MTEENLTPTQMIVDVLLVKPHTRAQIQSATGLSRTSTSRHIAQLREDGYVTEKVCHCPTCGGLTQNMVELLQEPTPPEPEPVVVKGTPIKRTKIDLPKYDGSVFGLMALQLGVSTTEE